MGNDPLFPTDRQGVWPVQYSAAERNVITTQAKNDRRNIPTVWYWRLTQADDDGINTTDPDDYYAEEFEGNRTYLPPFAMHIYIDWSPKKTGERKGKKKPGIVEKSGTVVLGISRAEARRVGKLLNIQDDAEGIWNADFREEYLFIPRPEDIFLSRGNYYQITQMQPEWFGPTNIFTRWFGTGSLARDDSTDMGFRNLPKPPTINPPKKVEQPRWNI